jgi:hypothetical protein
MKMYTTCNNAAWCLVILIPERYSIQISPEMKFLDINLTKDSSLLLQAIHSSFYWRILKKTILYFGFNTPYKKSAKQEYSRQFMKRICRTGKWGNKTRQRAYVQKPRLEMPFNKSISVPIHFDNHIIKVIYPAYLNLLRMWIKPTKSEFNSK